MKQNKTETCMSGSSGRAQQVQHFFHLMMHLIDSIYDLIIMILDNVH